MTDCHVLACGEPATTIIRNKPYCEPHAILRQAGWRCQALIPDGHGNTRRCPALGTDIQVVNGQALCRKHS